MHQHMANYRGVKLGEATYDNTANHADPRRLRAQIKSSTSIFILFSLLLILFQEVVAIVIIIHVCVFIYYLFMFS